MKRTLLLALVLLPAFGPVALAIQAPTNLIHFSGDQSVILHWDRVTNGNLLGYRVYRSTSGPGGPFLLASNLLSGPGYCDVSSQAINGATNFYYATAVDTSSNESPHSVTLAALPHPFATTNEFLDYVQQACFDYFWYSANPANGLVPDRSANGSACSIAAVGFGLTAIGIGVDHGWITRSQAVARVSTTLNTFWKGPQGPGTSGIIGYQGWFYHFLDMNTALRAGSSELSSIDTVWLLTGILYAKQYFNASNAAETSIRTNADAIVNRVNWTFMSQGSAAVAMGWQPTSGFSSFGNWVGYNEAMALYLLGMGTAINPLPVSSWSVWTSGYTFGTFYDQTYVPFPPLFGHQYSECWIDYRFLADAYMNGHDLTYFENSRRASLAEVTYSSQDPPPQTGYSSTIWGLTACDGPPPNGYAARGLPPQGLDDGTIAPTAAGGAIPFTPEYSVPSLMAFYTRFRRNIWTEYGFRDSFNLAFGWFDSDVLGIDQGPIVLMIENYRTQNVWQSFMANAEIQRGLQRAGFLHLPFMAVSIPQPLPTQGAFNLSWTAGSNRFYQVEYSPDLLTWFFSPGFVQATNGGTFSWLDTGPPVTASAPFTASQRFYRVFQLGPSNTVPQLTPLAVGTSFTQTRPNTD